MKKILGILLAVCFLLSVTAASASAHDTYSKLKKADPQEKREQFKKGDPQKDKKPEKKTWMKGHSEKKNVKHFEKKKVGQRYVTTVVYKIIYVWIPGFWSYCGNFNAYGYKFC